MFPSGGYFRSANCPFFVHGLCHRPYCHFRHAKPEYKPTSISNSSSVANNEPSRSRKSENLKCSKTEYRESKPHPNKEDEINTENTTKNKVKIDKDVKLELGGKQETVPAPANPIFKRTALEEKLIAFSANVEETFSESDSDFETAENNGGKEDKKVMKESIINKTATDGNIVGSVSEEARATAGEVTSVGPEVRPIVQEVRPVVQEVGPVVQEVNPVAGSIRNVTVDRDDSETKSNDPKVETEKTAPENLSHENTTDLLPDGLEKTNNNETINGAPSKKAAGSAYNLGVLIEGVQKHAKQVERKKEEVAVKDDINCARGTCETPETPQLSDVGFFSSIVVKRSKKKKKNNSKAGDSSSGHKKVMKKAEADEIGKTSKEKRKKKKTAKSREAKTSSTKEKSKIQRYKDLKKLVKDSGESVPSIADSSKNCVEKVREKRGKTVLVDSGSDRTRGDLEDDSEENELLRIFNDYDPNEELDYMDATESCVKKYEGENNGQRSDVCSSARSVSMKRPSTEKIVAGFKKQRVAHQPNNLIQRSAAPSRNSSSTFRRLPRPLVGTLVGSSQAIKNQTKPQGDKDLVTSTHVKRRVTHFAESAGTTYIRPRIRLEYGAKVPQSVRQKYLDKLVDEYLCIYEDQQEAFEKAEREEKAVYNKSPRRQVYINVCVNLIKRLRDGDEQPKESDESKTLKRNPLASKSSLPSLSKRLRIDTSQTNLSEYVEPQETVVNVVKKQRSVDDEITEEMFYRHLKKYVLSEEELVANGFPRSSNVPGRAEISDPYGKVKRNFSDPTRHICCRCGKPFVILESGEYQKEECVYHHGRRLRRRTAGEIITSYTCCQGEPGSMGCSVAKAHVREIVWSEESGFMKTIPSPFGPSDKIYALDCEMCYTTKGLELTRVTVVDYKHQQVYDTLVKPDNVILDYNTRFSGITEESMIGIKTTLREVQAVLLSIIHEDTVLLGHSLESDLKSLKLIHSTIVDTSVVFPHRLGPPYKRALRTLMGEFIRKIIQDSEEGHDSLEDAVSCVELMLYKIKEDMKIKEKKNLQ